MLMAEISCASEGCNSGDIESDVSVGEDIIPSGSGSGSGVGEETNSGSSFLIACLRVSLFGLFSFFGLISSPSLLDKSSESRHESEETILSFSFFVFFLLVTLPVLVVVSGRTIEVLFSSFDFCSADITLIYYGYNLYSTNNLLTRPRTSIFSKLYGLIAPTASEKFFHSTLLTSVR